MIELNGKKYREIIVGGVPPNPIDINLNGGTFLENVTTDQNITVVDEDLNTINPIIAGAQLKIPNVYQLRLEYFGTDDVSFINITSDLAVTYANGSGSDVGVITVSTDNVTFSALTYPFTPSVGTYFFKRSTNLVTASYKIIQ